MSGPLGVDMAVPRGLVARETALRLLPAALPPVGSAWCLHDLTFEPGTGCRLAFLLPDAGEGTRFVSVEVSATGVRSTDYRHDPRLPGLAAATDPAWIAERLAPELQEPVLRCRVEPLRYRPGARCVLRYLVRTPSRERVLVAKVLAGSAFVRTARQLALLDGSRGGRGLVPPTVAVWPEVEAVVSAEVDGRTVSAILGDAAVPSVQRVRLARRLGGVLARLHTVGDVAAPALSVSDQLTSLLDCLPAVWSLDPDLSTRLSALLDVLTQATPEDVTTVVGHGAFRAGQVVRTGDGRLVVLDVDGLCRCHPGRDLGTVLAHLHWQGLRLPAQRAVLTAAEQEVLAGYRAGGGVIDADALRWWRAAGMLQVAMRRYRRLEVADWAAVPALLDAATHELLSRRSRSSPEGVDPLDPGQMTALLRLALAGTGRSTRLSVTTAEPLRSAPGRRAVVRYRVRGLSGDGPDLVMGKWFSDLSRARLLHEHLVLLNSGPFGRGPLRVPEPLGLVAEQRLVLYRHCDGGPLSGAEDPGTAAEGVRKAASWLARLHNSDVGFSRRLSLPTEAVSVRRWATAVGHSCPQLERRARDLAEAWASEAATWPVAAEVPIHKDFHPGHVLLGEQTAVIDLDEARMGDPAFDVAHFCAYLDLGLGAPSDRLTELFVREYGARTGWKDAGTFRPFLVYTWLKIAKQWAMATGPFRGASPAQRSSGVAHAVGRGWACLNESSTLCAAGRDSRRRSS